MQPPVMEFPSRSAAYTKKLEELGDLLQTLSELTDLIDAKRAEILKMSEQK